ncbi:MAG: hypothetical protein KJO07_19755 [Deltaproteobacteria bacterium]|nr:hypothetical protein [Deltaproteobacteria bacterium]
MRSLLAVVALTLACSGPAKNVEKPVDPMPPEEKPVTKDDKPEQPKKPEPPPLPGLERITVTVVAAEVASAMKDGRPWDGKESRLVPNISKLLTHYLELHPELQVTARTLGIPVDQPRLARAARKDAAPDPMVFVEVGKHIYRSPARPRAFAPLWDFALTFAYGFGNSRRGAVPGSLVRIHVVDYDGPARFDTMGTTLMSIEQLLAKPVHKIGPFGSVESLTLQVKRTPLDDTARPKSHRLAVPGKPAWTVTGIDVVAGQRLIIEAADEVCTTREGLSKCSGPDGQRDLNDNNLKGFEKVGHGTLVGALGDTRFKVGRRLEMIAPSTGVLRLGVNDGHYVNNRGSYAARIIIRTVPVPNLRRKKKPAAPRARPAAAKPSGS